MSTARHPRGNTESVDNYLKAILYLSGDAASRDAASEDATSRHAATQDSASQDTASRDTARSRSCDLSASSADTPARVSIKSLAARLQVAPASVTNMLQKLASASAPTVDYQRHRGVLLSPFGRRRALEVVRHHRLIETFLYQILDYPIDEVHEEAERLEHFISERFEERIAAKLGHPALDPHGDSIPTLEGHMPTPPTEHLSLKR